MEEIKLSRCRRKSHVDIISEEMKERISKQEEIGISKCSRRSRVDIIIEGVKGWTSLSKQKEGSQKPTNIKDKVSLEQMKINVKRAALEWDDLVLQEQLKYFMYVDQTLRGYRK